MRALSDAGIEWELVPGISSALAAPLLAGVPLTEATLRHAPIPISIPIADPIGPITDPFPGPHPDPILIPILDPISLSRSRADSTPSFRLVAMW